MPPSAQNTGLPLRSRRLGICDYPQIAERMKAFTDGRDESTPDEIWYLQHHPVFTQGQAGKAEHLLMPGDIPVVQSTRGGQVTYHGPGQLVVYPLLDLRRRGMGVRQLVSLLEDSMVSVLAGYGIRAHAKPDAPGVYVQTDFGRGEETRKIGSVGLRVSRGCSYHGISLNVNMNLEPFTRINPCGYAGLRMTQIRDLGGPDSVEPVSDALDAILRERLTS